MLFLFKESNKSCTNKVLCHVACFITTRSPNTNVWPGKAVWPFFPCHLSWVFFINIPSVSTETQKANIISADLFKVTLGGHTLQELKLSGIRQKTQRTLHIPDNIRNITSMHHVLRKTFINKSLSEQEFRGQFVPNSTQRRNRSSTSLINI